MYIHCVSHILRPHVVIHVTNMVLSTIHDNLTNNERAISTTLVHGQTLFGALNQLLIDVFYLHNHVDLIDLNMMKVGFEPTPFRTRTLI